MASYSWHCDRCVVQFRSHRVLDASALEALFPRARRNKLNGTSLLEMAQDGPQKASATLSVNATELGCCFGGHLLPNLRLSSRFAIALIGPMMEVISEKSSMAKISKVSVQCINSM